LPVVPDGEHPNRPKLTTAERSFQERVQHKWPERRVISWRYGAPNPERIPRGVLAARRTTLLTTRANSVVHQITLDPETGRANAALFVDRVSKAELRATADVVLLCASSLSRSASSSAPHPMLTRMVSETAAGSLAATLWIRSPVSALRQSRSSQGGRLTTRHQPIPI